MSALEKPPYSDEFYEVMLENESTLQNEFGITDVKVCHLKNSSLVVAYIPADVYRQVISQRGSFEGALIAGAPIIMGLTDTEFNSAIDVYRLRDSPIDLRGQNTIIGIVDTGINYKDEEFIREDGTSRILNIWDMTIDSDDDRVCFGTEFSNEELTNQSAETSDEVGHGTKMAEVAGGRSGVAPNCEFIVVKLKRAKKTILDLYGLSSDIESYESSDVVLGIDYLVTKSIEYRKPISIILGLGTNQGGHDGLTIIERILSQMALRIGVGISVAAGNEALSGHHTSFTLEGASPYYDIEINVANNEKSFFHATFPSPSLSTKQNKIKPTMWEHSNPGNKIPGQACLRIRRAGFPTATLSSGISFVTTLPAPITQRLPIVTPGQMTAPPPIQQSSPIVTG